MKKVVISILIIIDLMICSFLFLTYGPIDYFRNLLVTTAMTTKSHHYIARTLYSDETIYKIMEDITKHAGDRSHDRTCLCRN